MVKIILMHFYTILAFAHDTYNNVEDEVETASIETCPLAQSTSLLLHCPRIFPLHKKRSYLISKRLHVIQNSSLSSTRILAGTTTSSESKTLRLTLAAIVLRDAGEIRVEARNLIEQWLNVQVRTQNIAIALGLGES